MENSKKKAWVEDVLDTVQSKNNRRNKPTWHAKKLVAEHISF